MSSPSHHHPSREARSPSSQGASPPELTHYTGHTGAYYDRDSFFQPSSQTQRHQISSPHNAPPLPRQPVQYHHGPTNHSHLPQSATSPTSPSVVSPSFTPSPYRPDSFADSLYTDTTSNRPLSAVEDPAYRLSHDHRPIPRSSSSSSSSSRPDRSPNPDLRSSVASTAYGDLPVPKVKTTIELTEDEEILACGIQAHEAGRLEESARLFQQAASMNNPNAMFLYGISLRHGWGCPEDPIKAFQYLQRAAEAAVVDLNSLSSDTSSGALSSKRDSIHLGGHQAKSGNVAKKELILAIYELGICFRHGWGVPKNKVTAVYYFDIAANLGDPDAQNEMGFCYSKGEGVKRDMYKAAHYYRLADAQGKPVMGNSWIYKKKYDPK